MGRFVSSPREREKRDRRLLDIVEEMKERYREKRETGMKVKKPKKLGMCQYDTDAPALGPSSPTCWHFANNDAEKGP